MPVRNVYLNDVIDRQLLMEAERRGLKGVSELIQSILTDICDSAESKKLKRVHGWLSLNA